MVAVRDPMAVPALRMTVDEYLKADLPEGYWYELVDGEVQMAPVAGPEHDDILGRLNESLGKYRQAQPGLIAHLSFNAAVPIPGKESVREPDLAVYSRWEGKGRGLASWKEFTPLLVVEVVSLGQENRDYQAKREDYFLAGLNEYWIVDRYVASMTVLTRLDEQFEEHIYRPGDSFISKSLPGFHIVVTDVFGFGS